LPSRTEPRYKHVHNFIMNHPPQGTTRAAMVSFSTLWLYNVQLQSFGYGKLLRCFSSILLPLLKEPCCCCCRLVFTLLRFQCSV
jgi:hypothetical protein